MSTRKKIPWSWYDLSETTPNDLVYYDTGIWAGYFLGAGDHHYQISKDLIELMKNGEKRVVVSYLLIMETIHVIRKRSVQRSKISDTASVLDSARALSDEFKDYVMGGIGKGELVLVESDGISGHGRKVFQKTSSVRGTVRNKQYKALGHADI